MIKKTIIDDEVMYVKLRERGLKIDIYFNRKGCSNNDRGHFVKVDNKIVHQRPAPALNVISSGESLFLETSGAITCPI